MFGYLLWVTRKTARCHFVSSLPIFFPFFRSWQQKILVFIIIIIIIIIRQLKLQQQHQHHLNILIPMSFNRIHCFWFQIFKIHRFPLVVIRLSKFNFSPSIIYQQFQFRFILKNVRAKDSVSYPVVCLCQCLYSLNSMAFDVSYKFIHLIQ